MATNNLFEDSMLSVRTHAMGHNSFVHLIIDENGLLCHMPKWVPAPIINGSRIHVVINAVRNLVYFKIIHI